MIVLGYVLRAELHVGGRIVELERLDNTALQRWHDFTAGQLGDLEPLAAELAKEQTLQLVAAAGLAGWDAGSLQNSVVAEGLVAVLIGINKRHKIKSAGIRITGEQAPN
jgi:hypothetical protein